MNTTAADTTTIAATPYKLRNGSWGCKVQGTVSEGDTVTVTTRAGKSWLARITNIVWSGEGVTLCATESLDRPSSTSQRQRGRRTGCSCGSREDRYGNLIYSERNCWQCKHDA